MSLWKKKTIGKMINQEIGGEFWLNLNDLKKCKAKTSDYLNRFGNVKLTTTGRGAISHLLDNIQVSEKKVLLPLYICESVIQPFQKAGFELSFYEVDKQLKPVNFELIEKFQSGIFLHMGYFGFPTNNIPNSSFEILKSKNVIIIEDATHTFFSNFLQNPNNDFIIGSIRKWFGVPSGGFIASSKPMEWKLKKTNKDFVYAREKSLVQKQKYITYENKSLKQKFLQGFAESEKIIDADCSAYKIDSNSSDIIQSTNYKYLISKRRNNFEFLLTNLINIEGLEILFYFLEPEITPMFFPIYVKNYRDELKAFLIKEKIYCPTHWPIPKQVKKILSHETKNIYDSILSIPCDQRYSIEDMQRITNAIIKFISNRM